MVATKADWKACPRAGYWVVLTAERSADYSDASWVAQMGDSRAERLAGDLVVRWVVNSAAKKVA